MLKGNTSILCMCQEGLNVIYINGFSTNLALNTKVFVNTTNNEVKVEYSVSTYADGGLTAHIFKPVLKNFTVYQEALDHYNTILEQYGKK